MNDLGEQIQAKNIMLLAQAVFEWRPRPVQMEQDHCPLQLRQLSIFRWSNQSLKYHLNAKHVSTGVSSAPDA